MSNNFTVGDLIPAIKDVIENGNEASFTPNGRSMRPFIIGGKDKVSLIKPVFPLKKYSVPLYLRKDGSVILHRIVKTFIKSDGTTGYVMRGDNTFSDEYTVEEKDIIAVMNHFMHNGKWHCASSPFYIFLCKTWCFIYPLRRFFYRLSRLFKRAAIKTAHIIRKK